MKVAIVQENIGFGGRIVVLAQIVKILNSYNIIPDFVGFRINISKEELKKKYNIDINFGKKQLKGNWIKKFPELNKIWFNLVFNIYSKEYDLIINSNNTTCLSNSHRKSILYLHFPRLHRIKNREQLIINNNLPFKRRLVYKFDYSFSKFLHFFDNPDDFNNIIANSYYTKSIFTGLYNIKKNHIQVIYPPVEFSLNNDSKNPKEVISIGRISPLKNQLLQIKIAKELQSFTFHIIGFASENDSYYQSCINYIKQNNIENVFIHTNLSYEKLLERLNAGQFYLHTMENEPFGITTVQAIAAGCIPVVHNSGGQKEIVPLEKLRFNDKYNAIDIIKSFNHNEDFKITKSLQEHIQKYLPKVFEKKFKQILQNYLK